MFGCHVVIWLDLTINLLTKRNNVSTAANMIVGEQLLDPLYGNAKDFASTEIAHLAAKWATYAIAIAGVLGFGWWAGRRNSSNQDANLASR